MIKIGINVLSLCDGMSGGQIALKELGIEIDTYFSFEIKNTAIKTTQLNFPNTIQLGDVNDFNLSMLQGKHIDLFLCGSPCQNMSLINITGKVGIEGEKSKLFYKCAEIMKEVNPTYFFLENVVSEMPDDDNTISEALGVQPKLINSNLFSAQDRERLYWSNIPLLSLPNSCDAVIKDIMETNVDEKYFYNKPFVFNGADKKIIATLQVNSMEMSKRVYNPNFKCGTLTRVSGGYQEKKVWDNGRIRKLTPIEYERLQTLPDNYTYGYSDNIRRSLCGNGWTKDVIKHYFKGLL